GREQWRGVLCEARGENDACESAWCLRSQRDRDRPRKRFAQQHVRSVRWKFGAHELTTRVVSMAAAHRIANQAGTHTFTQRTQQGVKKNNPAVETGEQDQNRQGHFPYSSHRKSRSEPR